jgi:glycosyltransferase involved in cell wall biosynthesis
MKILSLFYKDKKGGFTKRLYSLCSKLAEQGCEVHFLGTEQVPIEHDRIIRHIAPDLGDKHSGLMFWIFFMIFSLLKSFRIAGKEHIDRIVTFGPFYTALCILPILFKKIPAVTFIRADNMKHGTNVFRNAFFFLADGLGILLSSRIVFVSRTLMEVYRKRYCIPVSRCSVLPNGISGRFVLTAPEREQIRESLGVKNNEFLLSGSGIFNEGKNFSFLIHALAGLAGHVKLVLIGDDVNATGERQRLEQTAEDLRLAHHMIFAGWQEDPRPIIASSDMFLFPSRFEGSPNALIEALACNVPCLGSDIEEIREVLLYDDLLFSLDCCDSLARKISEAHLCPDTHRRLSDLSLRRCEAFTFNWAELASRLVCE